MLVFAFYSALLKKRPAMHPLSFLAFTMGWGTLLAGSGSSCGKSARATRRTFDLTTILVLIYVAIFPSIVAYVCYNRGVELVGPNRAAALYPLIVVFGAVIAIAFLGERPQLFHAVGYVLVFGGVLVATRQADARV